MRHFLRNLAIVLGVSITGAILGILLGQDIGWPSWAGAWGALAGWTLADY